jgi:hypothetical protein
MRKHPELGILTKWIPAVPDTTYVYRSWGLFEKGEYYGENFNFKEYCRVNSWISALFWFLLMCSLSVLPVFPPLRHVDSWCSSLLAGLLTSVVDGLLEK